MSSPDVSAYVDLALYDADPSTLVQRMILNAQQLLPGWTAEAGLPEIAIAESLALVVAELVFAVNRLPGATTQTLLQLFGITRGVGTAATATATFDIAGTAGATIPAATVLQVIAGSQSYLFTVDADLVIASGSSSGTASVTCSTNTAAVNGIAAGTGLTVLSQQLPLVNSVTFATAPAGGTDPETASAWLNRGATHLQGISSALAFPAQFTSAALDDTADGVYRATTTSNWNPTLSGGAGGDAEGCVTVSVMGQSGSMLTSTQKTNLQALLAANAVAGLAVYVEDPTVTAVNVTVTVWQSPGYTVSQVQANIAAQLVAPRAPTTVGNPPGANLSTDLWDFADTTVRLNDLITVITQTPGVDYVVSLAAPAADVTLPGVAPLAKLGTLITTVEGP